MEKHFQKITVGRDLGTELEVTSGLSSDDAVVANPGERLVEDAAVQVMTAEAATPEPRKPAAQAEAR